MKTIFDEDVQIKMIEKICEIEKHNCKTCWIREGCSKMVQCDTCFNSRTYYFDPDGSGMGKLEDWECLRESELTDNDTETNCSCYEKYCTACDGEGHDCEYKKDEYNNYDVIVINCEKCGGSGKE